MVRVAERCRDCFGCVEPVCAMRGYPDKQPKFRYSPAQNPAPSSTRAAPFSPLRLKSGAVTTVSVDVIMTKGIKGITPARRSARSHPGDPNSEIGIEQMANNAVAKKSSAAKYSHASRRRRPKVRAGLSKLLALQLCKQTTTGIDQVWRDRATAMRGVISIWQQLDLAAHRRTPAGRLEPAGVLAWRQTAARSSVPVDCVA
jgi:hypothetical protein